MKILFMYYKMKFNGSDYHRATRLTARLQQKHRVDLKYLVLPDDQYMNLSKDSSAFQEVISSTDFLNAGYNCVIFDDNITQYQNNSFRIPRDTLKAFHNSGGIVCFFFGDSNSVINNTFTVEEFRQYLGVCNHAHGGLYQDNPKFVRLIKCVQPDKEYLDIKITGKYLERFSPDIRVIYNGVKKLVADQAFHLLPGSELVFVGDDKTEMITMGDLYWDGPRPPILGNMSSSVGTTVFLTGHLWKDYIHEYFNSNNDNLLFIENLLDFCAKTQKDMGYHKHVPYVFVSYSHKDTLLVDKIEADLVERGVEVWRDVKEIRGGQSVSKKVEEGLRKADYYLLVLSKNALESGWVDMEYRTALTMSIAYNKKDWIIPIVTGVSKEQMLQFSLILADRKYVSFDKAFSDAIEELAGAIL